MRSNRARALAAAGIAWLPLALFATINGAFREAVLSPHLGPEVAYVLANAALIGAILLAALLVVGFPERPYAPRELLTIGLTWLILTTVFEFLSGRWLSGRAWVGLVSDYDPSRGRLFGLVASTLLLAPAFVGALRLWLEGLRHPRTE